MQTAAMATAKPAHWAQRDQVAFGHGAGSLVAGAVLVVSAPGTRAPVVKLSSSRYEDAQPIPGRAVPWPSYLERAEFAVLSIGSGAEAITMAADASPELVVLDLGLPDVPGETAARELRSAAVPIVMLTAKSAEEDRIAGLELGADDYVTKPFSPRELVLRVRAVLRRSEPAATPGT